MTPRPASSAAPLLAAGARLANLSTHEQLVDVLRGLVLDGSLPPGAPLREVELAQTFGVSRNTVREAIRALGHEGIVRHDRHRSALVVDLREDDVIDLYRVRRLLEFSAMDHLDRLGDEHAAVIDAAFARLSKLAHLGEFFEVVEADLAFHRSLVALHDSPRIVRAFDAIKSESAFCMALVRRHEREDERPEQVIAEHEAIRSAVLAGDRDRARSVLAGHMDHYEERTRVIIRGLAADQS